jgi:sugar lactone lactonase YvrE
MPKERPARNAFDALVVLAVLIASVWVVPAGLTGRPRAEARPPASPPGSSAPTASHGVTPVSTPTPGRRPGPVAAVVYLHGFTMGIAFGAGSLWAASASGRVLRIDPARNLVTAEIPVEPDGTGPAGIAFGAGAVWVPVAVPAALWRIDPTRNRVVAKIPLGASVSGTVPVAATAGAVWVAAEGLSGAHAAGLLLRVDPARNRVTAKVRLPGIPASVAASPKAASAPALVWAATVSDGVAAVDPSRDQVVKRLPLASSLGYTETVAAGAGAVWLADPFGQRILRVDPASMQVTDRVGVGAVTALTVDSGGIVWAVTPGGILRVTPGRHPGAAQASVSMALSADRLDGVLSLTSGGGSLWAGLTNSVARIDPRRLRP